MGHGLLRMRVVLYKGAGRRGGRDRDVLLLERGKLVEVV